MKIQILLNYINFILKYFDNLKGTTKYIFLTCFGYNVCELKTLLQSTDLTFKKLLHIDIIISMDGNKPFNISCKHVTPILQSEKETKIVLLVQIQLLV